MEPNKKTRRVEKKKNLRDDGVRAVEINANVLLNVCKEFV